VFCVREAANLLLLHLHVPPAFADLILLGAWARAAAAGVLDDTALAGGNAACLLALADGRALTVCEAAAGGGGIVMDCECWIRAAGARANCDLFPFIERAACEGTRVVVMATGGGEMTEDDWWEMTGRARGGGEEFDCPEASETGGAGAGGTTAAGALVVMVIFFFAVPSWT
jgi:hypothetical protein